MPATRQQARSGKRRDRGILALLAGLLAGAGLWWALRPPADDPAAADVAAAPAAPTFALAALGGGGPPAGPPDDALPEAVRRYLEATIYPPSSGRLTRRDVDLLQPNRRHERPRPIPDTLGPDPSRVVTVLFTADRWEYTGDQVVHATLEAWRGEEPFTPAVQGARAQREGRGGPQGEPVAFDFVYEDGRLGAELPLSRFADHHGPILLTVRFEYAPGQTHEETLRLAYTPASRIPARVTGELRDSVRDGNLRLDLGVAIERPGFYRFDANLYDARGEPVAFTIFKGELERGATAVPLEVFGKVLHDADAPGPYTVGEVRGYRFLDGQYPDREALPPADARWTTAAHPLDAFSDAVWTSPHKEQMVELMLDDAAAGISLDVPALPTPGEPIAPRPPDDDAEPFVDPEPEPQTSR